MSAATWPGTVATLLPFLVGWLLGWVMLWHRRPLPATGSTEATRGPLSVIVPARDEAESLPLLLAPLRDQLEPGDELIVVDDHSTDATRDVARAHGATVVTPPEPKSGWLGKPNACWYGADAARTSTLVFVDADVRPGTAFLGRVEAALTRAPDSIVSVQPWHEPGGMGEQLSMFFNIAALMGAGRFSVFAGRVVPRVAFGPVLATRRSTYDRIGGHAHPDVRGAHTEDIALARLVERVELHTGHPDASFRMYPGGVGDVVRGWTRSIAAGAHAAPTWATFATAAWIWAIAAAPFVGWWAYLLCVGQCFVLARKAGRFSPIASIAYPLPLAVFVAVLIGSVWRFALRRDVMWKGRRIDTRRRRGPASDPSG